MTETYFYLYKITHIPTSKIYIGVHQTSNLNDGYFGSGKLLKLAIKKHGIDQFKKEILEIFPSSVEMFDREKQIVNSDFIESASTYNLTVGGKGGWYFINDKRKSNPELNPMKNDDTIEKRLNTINSRHGENFLADTISQGNKDFCLKNGVENVMQLQHVKENHKQSLPTNHQKGELNSQFGKAFKFINKNGINKKVLLSDVGSYLLDGWVLGLA